MIQRVNQRQFELSLRTNVWLPQLLSVLLAFLPVCTDAQAPQPPAAAQPPPAAQPSTPAAQPPAAQPPAAQPPAPIPLPTVQGLKVVPLAGKGESNDLERKLMAPLVVQILDQNDRPVEGAEVVFRFPMEGPGATFPGGRTSQTTRTNGQGQAAAMNWMANSQVGSFDVHVSASYGNQVGETTFKMANATHVAEDVKKRGARGGNWLSSPWVKVALIGGAAALAAGIVLATRGSSRATVVVPPAPTITITPGPPTIGGH